MNLHSYNQVIFQYVRLCNQYKFYLLITGLNNERMTRKIKYLTFDLNLTCSDGINFYIYYNHYTQNFKLFPMIYNLKTIR